MSEEMETQHMIGMDITPMGMTRRALFEALGVIESSADLPVGAPVITSLGDADIRAGQVSIRCGYFFDVYDKLCKVVVKTHGDLPPGAGRELYLLFQEHMEDNYGQSPYRDLATQEGETGLESVWFNQGSQGNKLDVKLAWAAQEGQEFVVVIHRPSGTDDQDAARPEESIFDKMRGLGKG